jgi:hypothetical protein
MTDIVAGAKIAHCTVVRAADRHATCMCRCGAIPTIAIDSPLETPSCGCAPLSARRRAEIAAAERQLRAARS